MKEKERRRQSCQHDQVSHVESYMKFACKQGRRRNEILRNNISAAARRIVVTDADLVAFY